MGTRGPRPARLRAGESRVRCAAGTRTFRQLLLDPVALARGLVRRPFADPARDRAALAAGEAVAVSALRSQGRRSRHGLLVLRAAPAGPTVAWHPYRWPQGFLAAEGEERPVVPAGEPVTWRRLPSRYAPVALGAGEEVWQVAVPRPDAALLRDLAPPGTA